MKSKTFLRTGFALLLSVYCLHGLWSQQDAGPGYSPPSAPQTPNSEASPQPLLNPENPWEDLRRLIDEGMQGLNESNEALTLLGRQLETLKAETQEQRLLLEGSRNLVISLKESLAEAQNNVDIAVDRMRDAEDYALWIDAQNIQLKQDVERFKKSASVGFVFGGVGFGIGVPLALEGIRADNQTMIWSGVGTTAGTGLIWAAGHYLFKWW